MSQGNITQILHFQVSSTGFRGNPVLSQHLPTCRVHYSWEVYGACY